MTATRHLIFIALAGLLCFGGGAADSAFAGEPRATPGRIGDTTSCSMVEPRFQPKGRERAPVSAVKFIGGATLRSLVATPCDRAARPFDA